MELVSERQQILYMQVLHREAVFYGTLQRCGLRTPHAAGCRCLSWRCNARARVRMCHAVEKVSVCRSDCCQA